MKTNESIVGARTNLPGVYFVVSAVSHFVKSHFKLLALSDFCTPIRRLKFVLHPLGLFPCRILVSILR